MRTDYDENLKPWSLMEALSDNSGAWFKFIMQHLELFH